MILNKKSQELLEKLIGKTFKEMSEMTLDDEIAFVKEKKGKVPVFSKTGNDIIMGRGNPLIANKKICTMEDVDKVILNI